MGKRKKAAWELDVNPRKTLAMGFLDGRISAD